MTDPEALFGGSSIADMLQALNHLAWQEAMGREALEVWAAGQPGSVVKTCLADVDRLTTRIRSMRALLAALHPHEREIHKLVYGAAS